MSRLVVSLLLLIFAPSLLAAPVKTDAGLVEGVSQDGLLIYKGIPYAAPPLGDLRWRDPQPAATWSGVRKADRFSPTCMQTGSYPPDSPAEPVSEDCLYLNVWRPAVPADTKLPVMVWIYGGGLENGSASTPLYAGDVLARQGVIVVTFNYRLGVFGFLALPQLTAESPHKSSGDYGLLDQIAALRWVQKNIAAFGGDPNRVTVFGQSSGSISISALTASPLAKGLFQRAIGESGALFEPLELAPELQLPGAEQQGWEFMARAGAASLAALRAEPAVQLLQTSFGPGLILDGYALPRTPHDVYSQRGQITVPLLMGFDAVEGRIFTAPHHITRAGYAQSLGGDFPPLLVLLAAPDPGSSDASAEAAAAAFETDMRFRWDMWAWARLAAEGGAPVYFYEFDRESPFKPGSPYAGLGATHGTEMPYVFGHLDPAAASWTDADRRFSDEVIAYWTNFAKSGDPNGPGLPAWPRYSDSDPRLLLLGSAVTAGTMQDMGTLKKLDVIYPSARFVLHHPAIAVAGVLVLLILLGYALWRGIRRWLRPRRP